MPPPVQPQQLTTAPPQPPQPRPCLTTRQIKILFVLLQSLIIFVANFLFFFYVGNAAVRILYICIYDFYYPDISIYDFFYPNPTPTPAPNPTPAAPDLQELPPNVTFTASAVPRAKDCSICLEYLVKGDICRRLQACKHLFHSKCVDRWLERTLTCPICRTRVDPASKGVRFLKKFVNQMG